jgi:hypothetical protein
MGLYVYAVGRAGESALPPLSGILDQPVTRLDHGALSAVVSDCPMTAVRPERRNIAAAQRVLGALNAQFDLLPMAFGTVTKSPSSLFEFLAESSDLLTSQLERIAGAVEMGLRMNLDVPDPVAYLVGQTPALQSARERLFRGRRPPSHDEKIRLGQLCDATLRAYRQARTATLLTTLGAATVEIMELPVREDKELANLALLVSRSGRDDFDAAVEAAAAQLEDAIAFHISGPWPPHNFVQLDPDRQSTTPR